MPRGPLLLRIPQAVRIVLASLCKFDDLFRDDFIIDGLASAFVVKRGSRPLKRKPQQTLRRQGKRQQL